MKPTDEKQAFEVMQVGPISGNEWKVRGRCYVDIRVGDVLYAHIFEHPGTLPFEIVEIIAYGRSLPEISHGYACELTVRGDRGENLSLVSHLYTWQAKSMENSDEKQAFEVMQIEHQTGDVWKVRGRLYKDIQLGDVLYAYLEDNSEALPFELIKIMAYGRELSQFDRGHACELTVRGDRGENLSLVSHLYLDRE